jgi:uracil-DNA glycosylase
MNWNLEPSWSNRLKDEFDKSYFQSLQQFVVEAYHQRPNAIFPPQELVFRAFNACPFYEVKVVILGQDPYPTKGHANGLCFSINPDVRPFAKSLQNIFVEIKNDLGIDIPENGDLSRWANQGVLLLNAILTVEEGLPQSHKGKGWESFTDAVIQQISDQKEGVVFLLWGNYAKMKGKNIDRSKHLVLEANHPSPLSANRGGWFGCKHFSLANAYLKSINKDIIHW